MLKDISFDKVEGIAMAIIPEKSEEKEEVWYAYVINMKDEPIERLIVSSKGYGTRKKRKIMTSTFTHHKEELKAKSYAKLEMIDSKLLGITHEFWVSFKHKTQIYDKKYVFVAEALTEANLSTIPLVNKQGVMIK